MTDPPHDPTEVGCTRSLDLVRRAQGGDLTALSDLFGRYYERLRMIVRLRLGQGLRSQLESADILQETFIAAVCAFDRFEVRRESSLLRWLARIAENQIRCAADYHSAGKRDRQRAVPLPSPREMLDSGEIVFQPSTDLPAPLETLVLAEERETVEACLEELSPEHRDVILMRDYVGGRWDEVAEWLSAPSPDAARMLHARAITELSRLVRGNAQG